MKRESVSAYVHMRRATTSPCKQLYTFWMTLPLSPTSFQLRKYVIDGTFLNQNDT